MEPALCVAGVLVHGDYQSAEIYQRLDELAERHIPEADRHDVVFHATDIFHGSKYFDRRRWTEEKRFQILADLADIIDTMHPPVVYGGYDKESYGEGTPFHTASHEHKKVSIHAVAAMDCVLWTDRWLAKYAPNETALITAEDNDYIKKIMKMSVRVLRSPALMKARGIDDESARIVGLPLKRIMDTPHFAEKKDCPALQLADLCAFVLGRVKKNKFVPQNVLSIVIKHTGWITTYFQSTVAVGGQSS